MRLKIIPKGFPHAEIFRPKFLVQEQMEISKQLVMEMDPKEIFEGEVQNFESALTNWAFQLLYYGQNLKRPMSLTRS